MERSHVNDILEIIHRLRNGQSIRGIQRDIGHSRKTIRKYRDLAREAGYLDGPQLPSAEELRELLGPVVRPQQSRSTVEPYREAVEAWLHVGLAWKLIWRRLREIYGYTGSYSSVKRFCRRLEDRDDEGTCRVETDPGEEAQVDFGYIGKCLDSEGRLRRAWVFVITLCWSRHQYQEVVFDQKISTWLQCHENAFRWFGGVPKRIVIDNLKSAVLKRMLNDAVLSEPYRRMARHYGFMVSPNRPGMPQHKGKVERAIPYARVSFYDGEDLESTDRHTLNDRVKKWIMEVAGERDHGTTHEKPLARFCGTERDELQALPDLPFEMVSAHRAKLHNDCHVVVNERYYSAPYRLKGQQLEVYVGRRVVEIYKDGKLITTHPVVERRGGRSTRTEHYPPKKRLWIERPPQRCLELAAGHGEYCRCLTEELLSDRVQDRLESVHALLRLAEREGSERVDAACRRALHYGDPRYIRVRTILEAGLENEPLEYDERIGDSRREYRHARPASELVGEVVMR